MRQHFPVYRMLHLRRWLSPKQTTFLSDKFHQLMSTMVEPYEASAPLMRTNYPGPRSEKALKRIKRHFVQTSDHHDIINLKKSFGNYYRDLDNNIVLDMCMDYGRNSLGYNHRSLVMDTKLDKFERYIVQRPSLSYMPPQEFPKSLIDSVSKIAPENVPDVYLACTCGSSANENAIKIAFLNYLKEHNKDQSEIKNLSVLSFQGGYHGKFLNTNSASSNDRNTSLQNWPVASFPDIQYPYEDYYTENRNEEERCVDLAEKLIKNHLEKNPVAAMIIEPIQVEAGVRYASSSFYNALIDVCYRNGVAFICDETQTCGWASGRPFMHTNWNNEKPVHMVTFSGRMKISGFFMQPQFRSNSIRPIWNGDMTKIQLFTRLQDLVNNQDWLDTHAQQFMASIHAQMKEVQKQIRFEITNVRGIGKIFAFDVSSSRIRNELVWLARQEGFKVHSFGDRSIGFTPSLLFAEFHFVHFKNFLERVQLATDTLH